MKMAETFACPVPPRPDVLVRAYRGAWRFGGVPFLAACAALIAAGRLPGLADFLFWLTAAWIVLIRYVQAGSAQEDLMSLSPADKRLWRIFAVLTAVGAAAVYAAAKLLGRSPVL